MNCFDIISKATEMYLNRNNYAYYYGAKGQRLTDDVMSFLESYYKGYFLKYSAEELEKIHNFSRGKIGYDCSGFIDALTGQNMYSTAYFVNSLNKTSPKDGTWGNILYTTFGGTGRHIGIDIGAGRFLHMPREGQSVTYGLIADYPWAKSGQIKGVSYFLTSNK